MRSNLGGWINPELKIPVGDLPWLAPRRYDFASFPWTALRFRLCTAGCGACVITRDRTIANYRVASVPSSSSKKPSRFAEATSGTSWVRSWVRSEFIKRLTTGGTRASELATGLTNDNSASLPKRSLDFPLRDLTSQFAARWRTLLCKRFIYTFLFRWLTFRGCLFTRVISFICTAVHMYVLEHTATRNRSLCNLYRLIVMAAAACGI